MKSCIEYEPYHKLKMKSKRCCGIQTLENFWVQSYFKSVSTPQMKKKEFIGNSRVLRPIKKLEVRTFRRVLLALLVGFVMRTK